MIRYLTREEVVELHAWLLEQSGGREGLRDAVLNGLEMTAPVDEREQIILRLAAGGLTRQEFTAWVGAHVKAGPKLT